MQSPDDTRLEHGQLASAISTALVGVVRDYTGRGPTEARTTIDENLIVCVLGDCLTKGERTLVESGETRSVLEMRRSFQSAMRDEAVSIIEDLTRRTVVAFMSENHLDPDLSVETFVLEPLKATERGDGNGARRPHWPRHRPAGDHTAPRAGLDGRPSPGPSSDGDDQPAEDSR